MKSIKLRSFINVIRPEYAYIRLKPNNSIRNNNTHKLARTIATLHQNIAHAIRIEEQIIKKFLGKKIPFPAKISIRTPAKVSYFIYVEKKKAEFYFIIPKQHVSLLREKMSDVWGNVTIEDVETLPEFGKESTMLQMQYTKENAMSLSIDRRDNYMLRSTLNVIDVMEEGDKAGVFYNFIPVSQFGWRSEYKHTVDKHRKGIPVDRDKTGAAYVFKMSVAMLASIADTISEVISPKNKKEENLFETALLHLSGGKQISQSTTKKAGASILNTQIVVMSHSQDALRQRNTARSLAQAFDTISEDNALVGRTYRRTFRYTDYSIPGATVNKMGDEETQHFFSLAGRDILEQYNFIDKVETQETEVPEDLQKGVMRAGANRYRGKETMAYLTNDKEYRYLMTLLIGPTRAGKSELIKNLSYDAIRAGECVIIFDFVKNCELSKEVAAHFSKDKALIVDCGDPLTMQGLGYNEVGHSVDPFRQYDNAKKQTTQLMSLVNAVNSDDTRLSAKMERYLTSASLVVFVQNGSIRDVFGVLQDHEVRHEFLDRVPNSQKDNLTEYMDSLLELDEWEESKKRGRVLVGTKDHLIAGIIDRLNKLKANTYMEMMLKKSTAGNIDLVKEIQKNQLICLRMPETMFGTDAERDVYTTYWITKLWLALQIRGEQIPDRQKATKVNFIVDEIYQVANTEKFLTEKLSRLAKFGAKPIISCHYINQLKYIREELRSANASYMLISGCDKKNYAELKDELSPFALDDLLNLPRHHSLNLLKNKDGYARFITRLPPMLN